MLVVHRLRLPSHLQADAFARFAGDVYLPALSPALHGAAVRLVRRCRLAPGDPADLDRTFLLLVEGAEAPAALPRLAPQVAARLDAFTPAYDGLGGFEPIPATARPR